MHLAPVAADNVTPFPGAHSPRFPSSPRPPAPTEPTWSLPAIARLLGIHARSDRWQARYVDLLISNEGFPRPLPTMRSDALVHDIVPKRSRWLPAAVTAWLADRLPAEAAEADATRDAQDAADRLDTALNALFPGDAA